MGRAPRPPWQRARTAALVGAPLLTAALLVLARAAPPLGAGGRDATLHSRKLLQGGAADLGFSIAQPDPVADFGVPATIGLSLGVVGTVLLSGLSECCHAGMVLR